MKGGLETVCSHGQGKPFPRDLILLSISQQTHFSWLVMTSDSTCLDDHKVWISGIEMKEGGRHQSSVGVKNYDISAGQAPLRPHQTLHPRVCLIPMFIHLLLHHSHQRGTIFNKSLCILGQILRSFLQQKSLIPCVLQVLQGVPEQVLPPPDSPPELFLL